MRLINNVRLITRVYGISGCHLITLHFELANELLAAISSHTDMHRTATVTLWCMWPRVKYINRLLDCSHNWLIVGICITLALTMESKVTENHT